MGDHDVTPGPNGVQFDPGGPLPLQLTTESNRGHMDNDQYETTLVIALASGAAFLAFIVCFLVLLIVCLCKQQTKEVDQVDMANLHGFTSNEKPTGFYGVKRASSASAAGCSETRSRYSYMMRTLTAGLIPDLDPGSYKSKSSRPEVDVKGSSDEISSAGKPHWTLSAVQPERSAAHKEPTPPCGRLSFTLSYDVTAAELAVVILNAANLPPRDKNGTLRDPYVKVYLLPDESTNRESQVMHKTLAPQFNEKFVFSVSATDVTSRVLRVSMYDVDSRRVRHSLGHVMLPLDIIDVTSSDVIARDLELSAVMNVSLLGELSVSLTFDPKVEKLKVGVVEARNLRKLLSNTDICVRLQLFHADRLHKTKQTTPRHGTSQLRFDENFAFTVPPLHLDACKLVAAVLTSEKSRENEIVTSPEVPSTPTDNDADLNSSAKKIDPPKSDGGNTTSESKRDTDQYTEYGRITLGGQRYARGDQLAHWQEMINKPRQPICQSHTLVNKPTAMPTASK